MVMQMKFARISSWLRNFFVKRKSSFEERYRLGRILGSSTTGQVRLCTDKFTNQQYACKILKKLENSMEEISTEISIMKSLSSPHIVSFMSAYEDADSAYLVMELCTGGDLYYKTLKQRRLSETQAAPIFKSLILAVKHCHDKGVIHRDLKPQNILFLASDLKLVDFGLSTYFAPPGEMLNDDVGTIYYMAPEVLRQSYGAPVDVWSAGVILYFMLSGETPFDGDTSEEIEGKIKNGHVEFTTNPCWEDIDFRARDLIMRMLHMEPMSRITLEEVLQHPWILNNC